MGYIRFLNFLLLLPRAILSDPVGADYEHYIHDAHRHYQVWLEVTSGFEWTGLRSGECEPDTHRELFRSNNTHLPQCCADKHCNDCFNSLVLHKDITSKEFEVTQRLVPSKDTSTIDQFDEGPFLKMLFKLLSNMPSQPYQVNLHLTSIISKLALMPHPNLHEYLLDPMLPTAKSTQTLFKVLQDVAKRLTMEIPRLRNYKKVIENTRLQLMSEDPSYDESGEHNQLVESLIVLEEFCKELAAIAFVKFQHSLHMHR